MSDEILNFLRLKVTFILFYLSLTKMTTTPKKNTAENTAAVEVVTPKIAFNGYLKDVTCTWSEDKENYNKIVLSKLGGKPLVFLNGRRSCFYFDCGKCYGCKNVRKAARLPMTELYMTIFDGYFDIKPLQDSEAEEEEEEDQEETDEDYLPETQKDETIEKSYATKKLEKLKQELVFGKRKREEKEVKEKDKPLKKRKCFSKDAKCSTQ